jgi:hypothetical protein
VARQIANSYQAGCGGSQCPQWVESRRSANGRNGWQADIGDGGNPQPRWPILSLLKESQIESGEHQNDSDVNQQSFPEPVSEKSDI